MENFTKFTMFVKKNEKKIFAFGIIVWQISLCDFYLLSDAAHSFLKILFYVCILVTEPKMSASNTFVTFDCYD